MKKLFTFFTVMTLIFAMFTGCSEKKAVPENVEEPASKEVLTDKDGLFSAMEGSMNYMAKGISYDYDMTAGGQTLTSHYAFKDGNIRVEGNDGINSSVMITKGDTIYVLNLSDKTGFKMPKAEDEGTNPYVKEEVNPEENMDRDSVKIIGNEKLNGEPCIVFTTKDKIAGYEMKMWVHEKYGIMMKMEAETPEGKTKVEIKNLKVGDVSDSEFEIPADIQIMEMPAAPKL